ncbi:MAG: flagellar hook protein [Deltaproteobacteria bacterium]|nr:MAG: flagellar hook protein [Deltaproteobacteria bacterium]
MALSTQLVSGLASGLDWRSIIDDLMKIEHRPVDLVEQKKSEYEQKLSEWQSFNSKLLALKSAVGDLKDPEDFNLYTANMTSDSTTVQASSLLSVSTSSSASPGTYTIQISSIATAQKLSSASFDSIDDALGSSYAGDILINGVAISISASDTLASIRDKINAANAGTTPTGVTASIIKYGSSDYRLILTSDDTGADGIGLQNASSSNLLQLFGWKDNVETLKNQITNGAQSDSFSSSTQDIKTLLGLSTTQSGTIQIQDGNGTYQDVSIDLSTDSLEDIKNKINNASITGVTASVVTVTEGSTTKYVLQIDGSQNFHDSANILETLGVLQAGASDVQGTTSANSKTSNGETITASTQITAIDGYNTYTTGDYITISGTDHSGNSVNTNFTITANSTVQDLLDAIETAFEANGDDVMVYVTSDGKIQVADMESGSSSLSVSLTSHIQDSYSSLDWGTFSSLSTVRERELVAGQDASITIDGISITKSSNSITDVIPGVTLNLLDADASTTVTLTIDRDVDGLMDKINAFVDAYNEVAKYIHDQQSYDEEKQEPGGILFGDGTLLSIQSQLSSVLLETVWGVDSDFSTLGLVGINVDTDGQLSVDSDTLRGYLQTNFNDVKYLFTATGITSSGSLEYITHTRDTQAGQYTVNITQIATKSTSTSDTAVNTTLGADETITITDGDKTATISLTSDMTITDIINAINTELDTTYTETLVGSESLYADASQTQVISATTTWDSIYNSSGQSAGLQNGDVISFSGTTRDGSSISGSYEISDVTTDTVQGLLGAIQSAYGDDVSVSINGSGRIVVTDKYAGNSQLSLTITEPTDRNLDFGTVLTTNTDGQEGRYSMDITASNDGSNHLVLTYDAYGSSHSFTISESADLLWTSGDQTVNNGQDVAGTINGETATGSGQVLTGDDGQTNVDGLAIRYTGTDTGDVGTIKLTFGVAEIFDRTLFGITDTYEGYLAYKQESLQDRIDDLEDRIKQMEDRLDKKMEQMINQFVAMEKALAAIQSQSQWLSGQISTISSGWV